MLFLACNSFFSAAKLSRELQTKRALFLRSQTPKLQSSGSNWLCFIWRKMAIWFVTRWVEQFYRVCPLSASCSFTSVRFEIPPDHVRMVSATFRVNLKFTSKLNRCIYIEQISSLKWFRFINACWLCSWTNEVLSTSFSHFVPTCIYHGNWIWKFRRENFEINSNGLAWK